MARTPSKAVRTRDAERRWLKLHFLLFLVGMVAAFWLNRNLTPDFFWVQWVALTWGIALTIHGVHFARSTISTMGGPKA